MSRFPLLAWRMALGLGLSSAWPGGGAEAFPALFPEAAETALIRRLERGLDASQPWAGATITRTIRRGLYPDGLVIETTLHNPTAHPMVLNQPSLLDLTWRLGGFREGPRYQGLTYREETWYGSTFWSGPDWTRVGRDWHHPGQDTPSVRTFRCPKSGRLTVEGHPRKLHLDGDGVRLSIRHNEQELWQAELEGKDGAGLEHRLTLEVNQGDRVRFMVHKRGEIYCDTTYWNPTLTYEAEPGFQAARGFSPRQDQGPWLYEMATSLPEPAADPVLILADAELAWRELVLPLDQDFSRDTGPRSEPAFLILRDGSNGSGVLLAWEAPGPWRLVVRSLSHGLARMEVTTPDSPGTIRLDPGQAIALPPIAMGSYEGPWTASFALLDSLADAVSGLVPFPALAGQLTAAHAQATAWLIHPPDLSLLLMAQAEWRLDDRIVESADAYREAVSRHLRRAAALMADLRGELAPSIVSRWQDQWQQLVGQAGEAGAAVEAWRSLHLRVHLLKRDIALQNPLLDFEQIVFAKRVPPGYSHLVGQYFGWRQRPGGGLFVLEQWKRSLRERDLLGGQLPPGNVLEPCLSYDARRLAFSFVACTGAPPISTALPVNEAGGDERYFHLYEVGLDGSGLRQLTRGPYDDLMPAWLPDGGLAFCSTRRRGYSRCFGPNFSRRWHSYTLHRMNADGSGLHPISWNDVNEWFPTVSHDGHLLFARWDYIDRDAVTHQNLWAAHPDGSNPVAVWGNASPQPHCSFQARPVPGSRRIAFIASAHHALTAGPVCLLDPGADPNALEALTRITPEPFPEAESTQITEYHESPWPLSEKYFLVAYSRERLRFEGEHLTHPNPDNALGLYLIDAAGNRELIYRDPRISSTSPIPLAPRPVPPVLPRLPVTARDAEPESPALGEMVVMDVQQGLGRVPAGSIKALRLVQILPKTTWLSNEPRIGVAGEENARAILGTVPVESDGSARFLAPARVPLLFQVLDEQGLAYQTMRSTTYLQPGERIACVGCHEHRRTAPPPSAGGVPLALRRPASQLDPGPLGGRPFAFVEMIQPILDRHCLSCHGPASMQDSLNVNLTGQPDRGFTQSYWALCGSLESPARIRQGPLKDTVLVPRFPMRNQWQRTEPGGQVGARGSGLFQLLEAGHHQVALTDEERRKLAAWIDCNAVFHGSYDPADQARQFSGLPLPMPEIQ